MDSQYKVLSELLSDQDVFITSPKTSLANYWGALPPLPPSVYGPALVALSMKYNFHSHVIRTGSSEEERIATCVSYGNKRATWFLSLKNEVRQFCQSGTRERLDETDPGDFVSKIMLLISCSC